MADPRKTKESFTTDQPIGNPLATEDVAEPRRNRTIPSEANDRFTRDESEALDDDDLEATVPIRQDFESEIAVETSVAPSGRDWEATASTTADQQAEVAALATTLFSQFELDELRSRWNNVQAGFVDSPRRAVEQADELVRSVMQKLANSFSQERSSLVGQWDRGGTVSTEDLRVALQRYRTFLGQLLHTA